MKKRFLRRLASVLTALVLALAMLPAAAGANEGQDPDEVLAQQLIERANSIYAYGIRNYSSFDAYLNHLFNDYISYVNTLNRAEKYNNAAENIVDLSELLANCGIAILTQQYQDAAEAAAELVVDKLAGEMFPNLNMSIEDFIYAQAKKGAAMVDFGTLQRLSAQLKDDDYEMTSDDAKTLIETMQGYKLGIAALAMGRMCYYDQLSTSPWEYLGKIAFDVVLGKLMGGDGEEMQHTLAAMAGSVMSGYVTGLVMDQLATLVEFTDNPFILQWFIDVTAITAETHKLLQLDTKDPRLYPEYRLYFDGNGGHAMMDSMAVHTSLPYGTLPYAYRYGHDFDGWYDAPEGGNRINESDAYTLEENQTVYAHWTERKLDWGACGPDDLRWEVWGSGRLIISGNGRMWDDNDVPWSCWNPIINCVEFEGEPISISDNAFDGMTDLESITIPDTVVRIGSYAFRNTGLQALVLPAGLTSLGKDILEGNEGVKEIVFPAGLENALYEQHYLTGNMRNGVLKGSAVERVIFSQGITRIPDGICSNATKLNSVTIPAGVTEIGQCAFAGTPELKSIRIPNTVKAIREGAFGREPYVTVYAPRGVVTGEAGAGTQFVGAESGLESLTLPVGVETLESILTGNSKVTALTIPGTVTTAAYVTRESAVSRVTLQEGLIFITEYMFAEGTALTQITLPSTLDSLGSYAFAGTSLQSLDLPEGMTYLGSAILDGNEGVKELTVPASVCYMNINPAYGYDWAHEADIAIGPFWGSSIEKLTFAEGTTNIVNYVCDHMESLERLELPGTVGAIGQKAFAYCRNLHEMYFVPKGNVYWQDKAFYETALPPMLLIGEDQEYGFIENGTIDLTDRVIPDGYESAHTAIMNRGGYTWDIEDERVLGGGNDGILTMNGPGATEVTCTLPGGFSRTFNVYLDSNDLSSLDLPRDLTRIGEEAFANGTFQTVYLPGYIEDIGAGAFRNCRRLVKIYMPDSVRSIGEGAFYGCKYVVLHCESENDAYRWAAENGIRAVIGY